MDDDDCGSESAVAGTGGLGEADQAQGVVDEGEAETTKSARTDSEMTEEEVSETYDTFDEVSFCPYSFCRILLVEHPDQLIFGVSSACSKI